MITESRIKRLMSLGLTLEQAMEIATQNDAKIVNRGRPV